nr:NAC domain-containing protein [Endozoicomonas sp.]
GLQSSLPVNSTQDCSGSNDSGSENDSDGIVGHASGRSVTVREPGLQDKAQSERKQSRSEKKARKAMKLLNLKEIPGVTRVTMQRSTNAQFVFINPDVYKSSGSGTYSDTYVVFGEAKIEDMSQQPMIEASKRIMENQEHAGNLVENAATAGKVNEDEEQEVDDSGLKAKDIELVMSQAGVDKNKAVAALRKNDKDIVNSIMELTM